MARPFHGWHKVQCGVGFGGTVMMVMILYNFLYEQASIFGVRGVAVTVNGGLWLSHRESTAKESVNYSVFGRLPLSLCRRWCTRSRKPLIAQTSIAEDHTGCVLAAVSLVALLSI